MKSKTLFCFLSLCIFVHSFAQEPKIVTTLVNSGPKDGGSLVRTDLPALSPGTIFAFDNSSPHWPAGGVVAGNGSWLYGVTTLGGANNLGTLYRIQQNGTLLTTLYHFNSGGDRAIPYYHTDGIVYFSETNFIRKYNTADGSINSVAAFSAIQTKNLYIDSDDWMYFYEVSSPVRLVKMKTDGSSWTALHDFIQATDGSGAVGVTEVPGDTLFGVLNSGGLNGGGTIYSIKKDGSGFTVHHHFDAATGSYPLSKLVYFDGKLYGTTLLGGDYNRGVLFSINGDGTSYRVLRHFGLGDGFFTESSEGNIAISSNGRIFGTFSDMLATGSQYFRLFKTDTSGENFEPFFTGDPINMQRINGEYSQGVLLLNDQDIFFTTAQMGRNDGGVLNHSDTSGNGSDLYHFGVSSNGFRSFGGVIKASDGKLYGTTSIGGAEGSGVIFSMNADGTGYTRLKQLTDAEGYNPSGKLLEASDGKLYGACRDGGANNSGCIFRIDKNGNNFQVIYSYSAFTGGYSPVGGLIEDNTGTLYGVNFWSSGSIFKINKNGSGYTELKVFVQGTGDLFYPYNGLTLSGNYLYGATGYGGAAGKGGLFRIKKDGTSYQVLHEFNGTDGELPVGSLLLADNGKLYGSTANGGTSNLGTLFRIDTTGSNFITLRELANSDGTTPWTGMIQASDGLVYGGTQLAGSGFGGTLFRMNLDGSGFTIVRNFDMAAEGQGVQSLIDLNIISNPLPVQFITFSAQKREQSVLLSWQTGREENSGYFEIERSSDGNTFTLIGKLSAKRNTNTISSYNFSDLHPYQGINFYRLKEVDLDGTFSYSKTVSVQFDESGQFLVTPNPAADHLIIKLLQGSRFASACIFDAAGRLVLKQNISSSETTMDVHQLPRGWYVLKLSDANGARKEQYSFLKN